MITKKVHFLEKQIEMFQQVIELYDPHAKNERFSAAMNIAFFSDEGLVVEDENGDFVVCEERRGYYTSILHMTDEDWEWFGKTHL